MGPAKEKNRDGQTRRALASICFRGARGGVRAGGGFEGAAQAAGAGGTTVGEAANEEGSAVAGCDPRVLQTALELVVKAGESPAGFDCLCMRWPEKTAALRSAAANLFSAA